MNNQRAVLASVLLALTIAACGKKESSASTDSAAPQGAAATSGAPAAPAAGKIVVVELNSDAAGNYFKPASFEVHRGDVIRFTLKSGVHNVDFFPDSNAGKSNLPAASEMLQLPDQTLDIPVNFAPGTYYFQCDPHAALGMKGHVKVED